MALFALDEGFPETILSVASLIPEVQLRPLRDVDDRLLGNAEDWAILLRLAQHPDPFDGLITVDSRMIHLSREMAVLHQTEMTLVVLEDSGDDPVRATGLCLLHLPHIAATTDSGTPQLWILRPPGRKASERAWDQLGRIAKRQRTSTQQQFNAGQLTEDELREELWSWYGGIEDSY